MVVDPNRPLSAETLFRTVADGKAIEVNEKLNEGECEVIGQRKVSGLTV